MLGFVTSNQGKVREATRYLDTPIEAINYDAIEIQADRLEPIARASARDAFESIDGDQPLIVEDSGLFIQGLDGFPGPYSSYVESRLGIDRVASIAIEADARAATFRSVIAFTDGNVIETFTGTVSGRIVKARGSGGFGYDPIFEVDGETFAEVDEAVKNDRSHRGRALAAFASWYQNR